MPNKASGSPRKSREFIARTGPDLDLLAAQRGAQPEQEDPHTSGDGLCDGD